MNIPSIGFNCNKSINRDSGAPNIVSRSGIAKSAPLKQDSVSFGHAGTRMIHFVEHAHDKKIPLYKILSEGFQDTLEVIANQLEKYGFSFDRQYNSKCPVKSSTSFVNKIHRSGAIEGNDNIRATLYLKDLYNLELLYEKLWPAMQKRGFKLAADTKVPARIAPDLDIRLQFDDMKAIQGGDIKGYISGPQKSGYEDIQMRFVKTNDENTKYELIMLFGPNYAEAKHLESSKVYRHLRNFSTLNIPTNNNTDINLKKIKRYIEMINKKFSSGISEKLYANAKNRDYYCIPDQDKIFFTKNDITLIDNSFFELNSHLNKYYKNLSADSNTVKSMKKHDKDIIKDIQTNMQETIKYFNAQK
ncbi:MAG: hypothetical protein LBK53_04540 [Heliobacteriaceae bacterium]|nr:hypothetical protein [Heliobacteriaceae bacterium]